jgi:hypothetical protein
MRERRWETPDSMTFAQVLTVGERLAALGLKPAVPAKDVICYVEEWTVESPEDFDGLDAWATEDVTLVRAITIRPTSAIRTSAPTARSAIPGAFANA